VTLRELIVDSMRLAGDIDKEVIVRIINVSEFLVNLETLMIPRQ